MALVSNPLVASTAKRIDGMLPFISGLGRSVTFIWCGWSPRTLSAKETVLAERVSFLFGCAAVVVLINGSLCVFSSCSLLAELGYYLVKPYKGFPAHRDP
ncbi:hypothetical protein IFM89_031250 [Coptis chinensis]|uniref:Uncharacterized protein n=1 Tax=Coptis chinensis TaxID=261450 RepID=A0A835MAH4_9MAGN|nr:hypothetical protein IFM89_031250 [Coptis chinensis]